jgi:hypothetical protein
MNDISGHGFAILQQCCVHELIRLATALTDRPGEGPKRNLTIRRLIGALPVEVTSQAEATFQQFAPSLEVVRQHRNRRLMHFDLNTAMESSVLPRFLTDDLDAVVNGIAKVMSDISACVTNANVAYADIIIGNAGGALGWMISDSVRYRLLRQIASQDAVGDSDLRNMVRDRAGRHDQQHVIQTTE